VPEPPPVRPAPRKEVPRVGDLTGHVLISYTTLTVLVISIAVMMFLAFVMGYRMASRAG